MSVPFREVNRELSGLRMAQEVGLTSARERHKFACVTCDSSDALHAYPGQGEGLYCFGCGTSFSAVDLGAAVWGLTPVEACHRLAERFGIRPDSLARRWSSGPARAHGARHTAQEAEPADVRHFRAEVYGYLVGSLCLGAVGRAYLEGRGLNPDFASV